ncbi:hypothetical protein BGZ76_006975 [Entomortierella beljakovae]|nr:hypothetical protein BGZ76_006975 [Entomortierella beljakovae]
MKYTLILTALLAFAQAAPLIQNAGRQLPESYIIVLKEGHTLDSFQSKFNDIARRQNTRGRKASIYQKYNGFPGFAATVNDATLKELLASPEVEYIEQDSILTAQASQVNPPSWGLVRISHRNLIGSPSEYLYHVNAGQGVTAYVIDTGILTTHTDFGGRATNGFSCISGSPSTDDNGHGTHVAGIIGGVKHGVAKKVNLVGVKVLDSSGAGSISCVIAGMDWVAAHAIPGKSVINMSIGGGKSTAIDDATLRLYNSNVPIFVAGSNGGDSCLSSPSGSPYAFAVSSSDKYDRVASFGSTGTCIDIFAPGVGITSTYIGSNTNTQTLSGNSMATPHVAGTAALYQSFLDLPTAQSVYDKIISSATLNKLTGNLGGAPNRIVFNGGATGNDP